MIDITLKILDNGRVKLTLQLEVNEPTSAPNDAPKANSLPGIRSRRWHTETDLKADSSFVMLQLGSLSIDPEIRKEDKGLLLVVTPRIIGALGQQWNLAHPDATIAALPKSIAASPKTILPTIKAEPGQVIIQAMLLSIDNKMLQEAKIDLRKTIPLFSKANDNEPILTQDAANGLVRLLKASSAATVLSRPTLRTLSGQSAEVRIESQQPVLIVRRTATGFRRDSVQSIANTISIDVLPKILDDGENELRINLEYGEPGLAPLTTDALPIDIRRMGTTTRLKKGECFVMTDAAIPGWIGRNSE